MPNTYSVELLECLYQLINYVDEDDEALIRDAMLRYGGDYSRICNEARNMLRSLGEGVNEEVRRYYELLADHVMGKIKGLGDAAYALARYMGLGGREDVLKVQFRLMGFPDSVVEDLIRVGALMHRARDTLFVPEYLISRFLEISGNVSVPRIEEVLSSVGTTELVLVEAATFGVKPINWLFRAIYGVDFRDLVLRARVDGLLDGSTGELILNPAIEVQEIKALIHGIKDSAARSLRRALGPHGQYMYSKVVRCGVVYTVFGEGGRELIILCPWVLPSRRLLEYHSREDRAIVVGTGPSADFTDLVNEHIDELPPRTGFVFISGNEAMVYKPRVLGRSFDSFLDFLYRSNYRVVYLN